MGAHEDTAHPFLSTFHQNREVPNDLANAAVEWLVLGHFPSDFQQGFSELCDLRGIQPAMQAQATESSTQVIMTSRFSAEPDIQLV